MVTVTIYSRSGVYRGFYVDGHAGYAKHGYDIICSAVSVLTINAVNSVEELTDDGFEAEVKDGHLTFRFKDEPSWAAALLIDSMILGLKQIQKDYGQTYIKIVYEEV